MPDDDAEMVARKAEWLVNDYYRPEGLRLFKIKTGRARWMDSWDEALERDIAVFRAVREAVGPFYTLFVDVNNGYEKIGFYASVHMGFSVPNWAYAEVDDCEFPGLRLTGIEIRNGQAHLTGAPGLGIELDEERLGPPRFEIG